MPRRFLILIGILFAIWLAAAIVLFGVHHGDKPVHANAVFVLSGSDTRLPEGLRLMQEGLAPLLVVSETTVKPSKLEQQACAHRLEVHVLCVRASPYSTVGEAELLARLAAARHWDAVDVVTSSYHVVRARIILRRCYRGTLRVVGVSDRWYWHAWNMVLESIKLPYHELFHRSC
jgi:uncharacterized SAM-binding protein YcdF (DUF218 family)